MTGNKNRLSRPLSEGRPYADDAKVRKDKEAEGHTGEPPPANASFARSAAERLSRRRRDGNFEHWNEFRSAYRGGSAKDSSKEAGSHSIKIFLMG